LSGADETTAGIYETRYLESVIRSDRVDFAVLAALIAALFLGAYQLYPPIGWVDASIYNGYFRNLHGLIADFGATYFVERWAFILPGAALYSISSIDLANTAELILWFGASLLAIRSIIRPALEAPFRKLTLIMYGSSPLVIATVTRSYPDGAAIAMLLVGMALLSRAGRARTPAGLIVGAGCLFCLGILTQPGAIYAWGPLVGGFAGINWRRGLGWMGRAVGAGLVGVAAMLIVLMSINLMMLGTIDLWSPILATGGKVVNGLAKNYREPLGSWIFSVTRVWFVFLVLSAGLFTMAVRGLAGVAPALRQLFSWALGMALGSSILMSASDAIVGTATLQFPFYASYLLPSIYLLLAAILRIWTPEGSGSPGGAAFVIAAIMGPASLATTYDIPPSSRFYPLVVGGAVIGAAAIFVAHIRMRTGPSAAKFLLILVPLSSISVDTRHVWRGWGPSNGDTYRATYRAADAIDSITHGRKVLFWFDRAGFNESVAHPLPWPQSNQHVYQVKFAQSRTDLDALDTLAGFYLWDRSLLNAALPLLTPSDVVRLNSVKQPVSVVVASYSADDITIARRALEKAGLTIVDRGAQSIPAGSFDLNLSVFDIGYVSQTPGLRANGLLDRFPCSAAAAWLTSWINRPDLIKHSPVAEDRLSTMLQGTADKSGELCFAEAESVRQGVDLEWRAGHPPPAGAQCDADLSLAATLLDRAFDDGLRAQTRDIWARALAGWRAGDRLACLIATSTLIDTYREAIGVPIAKRRPLDDEIAAARGAEVGLSYPISDAGIQLLKHFPCQEAANWITSWISRPDLVRHSSVAETRLSTLLQGAVGKAGDRCFAELESVRQGIDLEWRADRPPPKKIGCSVDLALSSALVDRSLDETLRAATAGTLKRAILAFQSGNDAECLIETAAIRSLYASAVRAPSK
jgi:hypothetical protein